METESEWICYACGADATRLYEGTVPPAGSVRKATCEEHTFDGMDCIEYFEVNDD